MGGVGVRMILAFVAMASAAPTVIAVREEAAAFSGAVPRVTVTDPLGHKVQVDMADGGAAPDATAKDGVWTGSTDALGPPPYDVLITDGGDMKSWKLTVATTVGRPATVRLSAADGGKLTPLTESELAVASPGAGASVASGGPPPEPGPGGGAGGPPESPPPASVHVVAAPGTPGGSGEGMATPEVAPPTAGNPALDALVAAVTTDPFGLLGGRTRAVAWAGLLGLLGWVLAGTRRFSVLGVEALAGPVPPLSGRGVVPMEGDWAGFVRTLAGPFRVILVGGVHPGEVPGGTVFPLGPERVAVDDVVALLEHLLPTGPPVVVVVAGSLEASPGPKNDHALLELGRRLPKDAVAYVFASAPRRPSSQPPSA